MNGAIRKCPSCGDTMKLVTALTPRPNVRVGDPLKPIRYVCRCGKMIKA